MTTRRLLRDVCHRTMTTPISPLPTRLIRIITSCWTIYHSFEMIHQCELAIGLEFKSNVLSKSIALKKNIQSGINYTVFLKILNCRGLELGLYINAKGQTWKEKI